MDLKWIEPESRFIINSLLKRDFDAFTDEAKRTVNWSVLIGDVAAVVVLLSLL
jgi:hypothetical protein